MSSQITLLIDFLNEESDGKSTWLYVSRSKCRIVDYVHLAGCIVLVLDDDDDLSVASAITIPRGHNMESRKNTRVYIREGSRVSATSVDSVCGSVLFVSAHVLYAK